MVPDSRGGGNFGPAILKMLGLLSGSGIRNTRYVGGGSWRLGQLQSFYHTTVDGFVGYFGLKITEMSNLLSWETTYLSEDDIRKDDAHVTSIAMPSWTVFDAKAGRARHLLP